MTWVYPSYGWPLQWEHAYCTWETIYRYIGNTHTRSHTYSHTQTLIIHFILHTHTYRGQSSAVRLTGNNRDYTVSLSLFPHPQEFSVCPLGSNRKIDLMDRKQQPPALTDAWINCRLLQGPFWDRQPPQPIQSSPNTQAQDMQSA